MRVMRIRLLPSPLAQVCTQRSRADEGLAPHTGALARPQDCEPPTPFPASSLLTASAATQQDRTLGQPRLEEG